ncbi:MAG: efflux RND transporter periplasmic adaptor subunit [Desulfovibrionaceae bacterium]|nr:efflux RND transporter periplasmic adaptor subunit [Desulfovibrionaceae bacterium]
MSTITKKALLGLLLTILSGCTEEVSETHTPEKVRYATVETERIAMTTDLPGRVSALVMSEVRPQVDGIILERLFEEGADVKKGQVLYHVDPAVYQAAYNTAKAILAEAEANVLALALKEKRYRRLIVTKSISRQELDNAIAEHAQARARIARAKAELETAAINLAYTQIKAPVSGRIGASSVTVGALVTANQSSALAVIQQTDRVYVDITQSITDNIRLRRAMAQGQMASNGTAKVRLTLEDGSPYTAITQTDGEPEWIQGVLLFSEISVGQSTGSLTLRAVFSNPDGLLLPGMYVKAIIEEGTVNNAILIPQRIPFANNISGHSVYVLQETEAQDGLFRVERRDVQLERALGHRWIVSSGLKPGDRLILEGLQKVAPGDFVQGIPEEDAAAVSAATPTERKDS